MELHLAILLEPEPVVPPVGVPDVTSEPLSAKKFAEATSGDFLAERRGEVLLQVRRQG